MDACYKQSSLCDLSDKTGPVFQTLWVLSEENSLVCMTAPTCRVRPRTEDARSNHKAMQPAKSQWKGSETVNKLSSLQNQQQTMRMVSSIACMCNEQLSCPENKVKIMRVSTYPMDHVVAVKEDHS